MTEKINTIESSMGYERSQFEDFMQNDPKPIVKFVPDNAAEQKALFLSGEAYNPRHVYSAADSVNFEDEIESLERKSRSMIIAQGDLKPVQEAAYRAMAERYIAITRMMQAARDFRHAASDDEKNAAKHEFMTHNIEVYGEPNEATYRSIMCSKLQKIQSMPLDEKGEQIRSELFELIDVDSFTAEQDGAFEPSPETVEWMQDMVMHLYGPWFRHIPEDTNRFDSEGMQRTFQSILDNEFGGAADGWSVVIRDAQSVNVRTSEKEIVIPPERNVTLAQLKRLICHEIGVHALRSIVGEQTDTPQLRIGTASYYDSDEGLGVVVEDAHDGVYRPHGENYYLVAGLSYFEHKDFRDTFEIWSRMYTLLGAEGQPIDDAYIEKKRRFAYGNVMRIMRGTDELPWFKDLGYYNGANKVWQFLEKYRGDEVMFMMLITGGKIDLNNPNDTSLMLESRTP